jgi:hypothetical protein
MRVALPLLVSCAALAACTSQPYPVASTPPSVTYRQSYPVNSTPPSVSYRIPNNNNVAATSAEAQNYCAPYGRAATYRGVQEAYEGPVAVYTCDGVQSGALTGSTVPPGAVVVVPTRPAY